MLDALGVRAARPVRRVGLHRPGRRGVGPLLSRDMPFYDLRGADFREVFRWLFATRGDPWLWRLHARRLARSADVLFDLQERETSLGSWFPACLLAGAALEAYLKGLIVKREGLTFEHGLPMGFKTHRLDKLFLRLQTAPANEDELRLICILTEFVIWAGRYPVPVDPADMGVALVHPRIFETHDTFRALALRLDVALGEDEEAAG